MEVSIQLEDATIQQVVQDFVIPKFIPPFCHSHPLEEEASELFNNGTTTILQALYVLKHLRNSTKGTPILSTQPELSHLEWAIEFYLFLFVIDDVAECKTRIASLEDLE